ncbi:hypothetical protein BDY19DRAFT_984049 [Irpex rosettiformis]|uniref:Uncharacterized protein n=1 Tax=Irpex rosettiformis TaxID=378272 RepID=A0ACB8UAJ3_9APHY|nr:hypothetical protein BDY19DRAFT_984049 [Irpex rosettiformis]
METQDTYGRNRQSMADIEEELLDLFHGHPKASSNSEGEPVIPGDAIIDILRSFSANHNHDGLLNKEEEAQLVLMTEANPDIQVTPSVLLQLILTLQQTSQQSTSEASSPNGAREVPIGRGRPGEKTEFVAYGRTRSTSQDVSGASVYGQRPNSRPSSRPPSRPQSRGPSARESPFDAAARQRSTPLAAAPSSWARRPPPSRRKSDAGARGHPMNDTESASAPPVAYSRSQGQMGSARVPSTPTTPEPYSNPSESFSPISIGSPNFNSISRPHSRSSSVPQNNFASLGVADGFGSPERDGYNYGRSFDHSTGMMSPPPSDLSEASFDAAMRVNLARRRGSSDSSDEEGSSDEDMTLAVRYPRTSISSNSSVLLEERFEALQKVNEELRKKLKEAEESLRHRMEDSDEQLDRLEVELQQTKDDLTLARKQEKELKAKERQTSFQISTFEHQISKLERDLESSKASYTTLQVQYQEQLAEAHSHRAALAERDREIQSLRATQELQAIDLKKWEDEHLHWQLEIKRLEDELTAAHHTQLELDHQKQENLALKETIDRMKYEMEEMRQSTAGPASMGGVSAKNSISRSLGAELASQMKDTDWDTPEDAEEAEEVEKEIVEDEDTEGEEFVQTIITRTKKKVASRAKRFETITIEDTKTYSDAEIQHDLATGTFATQTEPESVASSSIQTDLSMMSTEIQTDAMETQTEESELASLASSSSTIVPATPKADHVHDSPPTYGQVIGHDHDELATRVADETLKKWHPGLKPPIKALSGGISEDTITDWKTIKEELGIECTVIDRIVEDSPRTGLTRDGKTPRSRFYNIYNTYVYGGKGYALLSTSQIMFVVGATAATAFLLGQAMTSHHSPLGGPTYYDRAAWSSFNSIHAVGEGFPGDGSTAFWSILGRIGGGAARTLRGFPT